MNRETEYDERRTRKVPVTIVLVMTYLQDMRLET